MKSPTKMPINCSQLVAAAKDKQILDVAKALAGRVKYLWDEEYMLNCVKEGTVAQISVATYSETKLHCDGGTTIGSYTVAQKAYPCRTTIGDILGNGSTEALGPIMGSVCTVADEMLGPNLTMTADSTNCMLVHTTFYTVNHYEIVVRFSPVARKPNYYIQTRFPGVSECPSSVGARTYVKSAAIEQRRRELWEMENQVTAVPLSDFDCMGQVLAPHCVSPYYYPATIVDALGDKEDNMIVIYHGEHEVHEYPRGALLQIPPLVPKTPEQMIMDDEIIDGIYALL